MEAATVEREQDIAALQADLGSVRSELEHWRSAAAKYEEEIGRLQQAFTQQQQHQNTATQLQGEPGPHSSPQASECPLQPRLIPDPDQTRLSCSGVWRAAAAMCLFTAGMWRPEKWKNGSFRQTAAPADWTQQVDIGNMWHLALDSTKTILGRPVRTYHHDVISVCISAWLQHQRAQSSPQQQFGVPGEKGGSPAGQAGFSRKSTRAGRQQVEDPAGPGSGPHTHITEGGTHFYVFLNTQAYKKYNMVLAQGCNKANCERNISVFKVPQPDDFVCVYVCVCVVWRHTVTAFGAPSALREDGEGEAEHPPGAGTVQKQPEAAAGQDRLCECTHSPLGQPKTFIFLFLSVPQPSWIRCP